MLNQHWVFRCTEIHWWKLNNYNTGPNNSIRFLNCTMLLRNNWIQNVATGYASLECWDMSRRCCNSTGGWMRVAHLNMADPTHHCPMYWIESPKRTYGRPGILVAGSTRWHILSMVYHIHESVVRLKSINTAPKMLLQPYYRQQSRTILMTCTLKASV